MIRNVRDKYLPPDRDAFVAAEPPTGRVIVVAPTRAACETIEIAVGLHLETFLEREHGDQVRELARSGKGFGIVAGTGTGKTLAIRIIAEEILKAPLRVGVVNREREATPETPSWNVIVVTTGIARRWFQDDDILPTDTIIVDEIHQTSAELELVLALGKRVNCRYIWLSATVDPTFYARYLGSSEVIHSYSFDPTKAAKVRVLDRKPLEFLDENFLRQVIREQRGVAMFLPTRAGVEAAAEHVQRRAPRINASFYHGGEPIRVMRPFLEAEGQRRPYFLAMTAAGQSALNVRGLDTVIIDDVRFTNIIDQGRNVLTQVPLGANEILQMGGRVHGRVEGGRVFILSDRDIEFTSLQPTAPEFQLAGDSERVAITCADIGVRVEDLELPVPLDKESYRLALAKLIDRGIIDPATKRLTSYGKAVEAMPVDRPWAELLVHAEDTLLPYVAVMSGIESLHRMLREDRDLEGLIVPGSDHLTAYNIYAEAFRECGYVGEVYGLPRHQFDESIEEWAERRGVMVKALEDAALGMASVYRSVGMPVPTEMPLAWDDTLRAFGELLARFMPFDLVMDERTADGDEVRLSKTSVCNSWGAIAGEIRYFADRNGIPRAGIEGTQVPFDAIKKNARKSESKLVYVADKKHPLATERVLTYFGFELGRDRQSIRGEFPPEMADDIRRAIAEALASGEARHPAVGRNRGPIEELREVHRRSGGATPRFGNAELADWYRAQLSGVRSVDDLQALPLRLDPKTILSDEDRSKWLSLPHVLTIRDREVDIAYEVEEGKPVARLRLPERLARSLEPEDLPKLDRPLRFLVHRGQRKSVRADTLEELQQLLARPWRPDEEDLNAPPIPQRPGQNRAGRKERFYSGNRGGEGRGRSGSERGGDGRGDERGGSERGGPPVTGRADGRGRGRGRAAKRKRR